MNARRGLWGNFTVAPVLYLFGQCRNCLSQHGYGTRFGGFGDVVFSFWVGLNESEFHSSTSTLFLRSMPKWLEPKWLWNQTWGFGDVAFSFFGGTEWMRGGGFPGNFAIALVLYFVGGGG